MTVSWHLGLPWMECMIVSSRVCAYDVHTCPRSRCSYLMFISCISIPSPSSIQTPINLRKCCFYLLVYMMCISLVSRSLHLMSHLYILPFSIQTLLLYPLLGIVECLVLAIVCYRYGICRRLGRGDLYRIGRT